MSADSTAVTRSSWKRVSECELRREFDPPAGGTRAEGVRRLYSETPAGRKPYRNDRRLGNY
ncbi:hypothetical protein KIN20_016541 [Parelaphostrongylus tenuis]|uniref:Uncharacterized protein n=1 Tax=Parelaphostrongylus tenuis TaxID=148309 RepID=A0AAD5QT95_PARTN|nr:hypothetical protein KIN20_016541 [Parelaphostrongylus tenuis]